MDRASEREDNHSRYLRGMRSLLFSVTSLAALLALGCASSPPSDGLEDVIETRPDATPLAPHAECVVTTGSAPADSAAHVPVCSELDYPLHPPAGGPHYGVWADFAIYEDPVPWGFLVHALEHGAVILAHNCEGECPEVRAAFERIHAERDDPGCRTHPNGSRIIIVPDPTLETPIVALAWEHVYQATCLDEPSLRAFVDAHYAQAPENICAPGMNAERTTSAWCP